MTQDRVVQAYASLELLEEINRVLEYDKILGILKRSGKEPSSIMATVVSLCSLVDMKSTVHAIEGDPSDNQVLTCAKDASTNFIISGDRHLLQLGKYEDIIVLTTSGFLQKYPFPKKAD